MKPKSAIIEVCMVIPTFLPQVVGGAQSQVLRLSVALQRNYAVEPWILTQRLDGASAEDMLENIPVRRVSSWRYPVGFLLSGFPCLTQGRPDIIHVHALSSPVLLAVFSKQLIQKPVIVKVPSAKHIKRFFSKPFSKRLAAHVDAFVALTPELEQVYLRHGVPPQKIWQIPNGIDTEEYSYVPDDTRQHIRQRLGIQPEAFVLSFAGRLIEEKNIEMLLQAWASVSGDIPAVHLYLMGDGPMGNRLRAMSESLGIANSVSFLGELTADEVREYMTASDVFVLPSKGEGISNALLEAMATGTAAIVTEPAATQSLVEHRRTGLRVNTVEELQQAIVTLFSDRALREKIRLAARRNVEEQFSIYHVAKLHVELYHQLLTARRPEVQWEKPV